MNNNFSRIITLLRKERGCSQKKAAAELGVSQALLSHYEKGIRECGLDFVVKIADYYNVSCDYLLGRTPHRSGATISVEDIPEPDSAGKENVLKGSLLPVLNKKLIANSLNIIYGILQKCGCKSLTNEVSAYLNLSIYKVLRMLYSVNPKNPQGLFSVPLKLSFGRTSAAQEIAFSNAKCLASGTNIDSAESLKKENVPVLTPEKLSAEYPLFSSSLFNLVQNSEARMGVKQQDK